MVTGIIWVADKFYLAERRQRKVDDAQGQCAAPLTKESISSLLAPSTMVDTSIQIFPVIAFVLILRSFIYEPFQIPSGSMMPTLLDGDFILVNKFNYGLRDPVIRNKFYPIGLPVRGDVVVFKYPDNPKIDFIKRVIGLPGERVIYRNKSLYIKPICLPTDDKCPEFEQVIQKFQQNEEYNHDKRTLSRYTLAMSNKTHDILIDNQLPPRTADYFNQQGTQRDEFIVPDGHYFVMGDNRDNSLDGRYWGFVPEENLVGEAVAIWMSFDFDRDENDWLPHWIPTGVRLSRLGAID